MSTNSEAEVELLARLEELLWAKRTLLKSIDINMAKLASGLPAEENEDD